MGQSTEEIEARLAAYIDGTLDEAGRAEIERHLATHPQHRTLLEELSRHRELLRHLPTEKAPP
ncbi:MAG: zf-HC2 domain-containing protein, partial [Phycisphaerales bacterium]|nr:zf-HC2 domain-containing protein [Phycisphaerales bacterium]